MSKTRQQQASPPIADQLEVSVFGPGVGECLVVHLGYGEWMVVDSCLSCPGGQPIALEYLNLIGVDVARNVVLVVVTHWHDDHIRGISGVFRAAENAKLVCSAALRTEEFQTLLAVGQEVLLVEHTSGTREFVDLLEIRAERDQHNARGPRGPDFWAQEGLRLHHRANPREVSVWALSPSAQTVTAASAEFAQMLPTIGAAKQPLPVVSPNGQSVVLRVDAPGMSFLLGGDLECHSDARRGWGGVLASNNHGRVKSRAFKVAHHGSPNADHPAIWGQLLAQQPHALLTPYARGREPRPSDADIARLRNQAGKAHCTVWPLGWAPPRRRGADRLMATTARNRRAAKVHPGQVRIRAPFIGEVSDLVVETFDGAGTIGKR